MQQTVRRNARAAIATMRRQSVRVSKNPAEMMQIVQETNK